MNWKYKSLLQRAFSSMPYGEQLNYCFQKYVTKSMPVSEAELPSKMGRARDQVEMLLRYGSHSLGEASFYEFGAGWDLIGPLTYYSYGVERQLLVDIRVLLRPDLVNDAIDKIERATLDQELQRKPQRRVETGTGFLSSLKESYGIEYRAPCDARDTGLENGSIHYITSSNTLEHIPRPDIEAILCECHRLLRDDGLISFRTDYQDHYSYFDRSISAYSFLRYSEQEWQAFNPSLHYQNRMRHRDYLELFQAAGFEFVDERRVEGTADDLATIQRLPLSEQFRSYTPAELAVRRSQVVLRKRCAVPSNSGRGTSKVEGSGALVR